MRKILLAAALLVAVIYLVRIISLKLARCPKCNRRGVRIIEKTKYWVKFKCDHCGHTYVEETGH